MKFTIKSATAWLLAAVALVASGAAMATNGYFTHGVGTQSKGMAGTGVRFECRHGRDHVRIQSLRSVCS